MPDQSFVIHLLFLGGHAFYADEIAAGLQFNAGLLQTNVLDTKSELEMAGDVRSAGLLGLIQKDDKAFRLTRQASFRAVNHKGFMIVSYRHRSPNTATPPVLAAKKISSQNHCPRWIG